MNGGRSRIARIGTVLSQLVNVVAFNGNPAQALSARAWRQGVILDPPSKRWVWYIAVIDRLFFWEEDHCRKAFELSKQFSRIVLALER